MILTETFLKVISQKAYTYMVAYVPDDTVDADDLLFIENVSPNVALFLFFSLFCQLFFAVRLFLNKTD